MYVVERIDLQPLGTLKTADVFKYGFRERRRKGTGNGPLRNDVRPKVFSWPDASGTEST